jgi:cyclohexanecarboxyl-CoA dehydrogenase
MNPCINEDLAAAAPHARRFATEGVAPEFLDRDQKRVVDRTLMAKGEKIGFIAPAPPAAYGNECDS